MRRRAQVGLNKGEAHHALKRAIDFHQRGELRDRTGEGQHYRIAGLNLLAAIIIYWNTQKLRADIETPAEFLTQRLAARMGTYQPDRRIPVAGCRPAPNVTTLNVGFRPLPQTTRSSSTDANRLLDRRESHEIAQNRSFRTVSEANGGRAVPYRSVPANAHGSESVRAAGPAGVQPRPGRRCSMTAG